MVKIAAINKNTISSRLGLKPGDEIISINDKKIDDFIDYQYEIAEPYFIMTVRKKDGRVIEYEVEQKFAENLGISFEGIIYDRLKKCSNDCIFCFVKQQPESLRDSLLIKDDDYRFSFLQGSFITLTNLTEKDWEKIAKKRLSPLYISVHTTNPALRTKLMKNPEAGNIMGDLKRLSDNNIKFHAQIVLCPDINDGAELERTVDDLKRFYPDILSLGVVPVGLTKYRQGLAELNSYTRKKAREVLDIIEKKQKLLIDEAGQNWLYASDEFYFLADRKIPDYEDYNGFPQIENGIGLCRLLWNKFEELEDNFPKEVSHKKFTVITSQLGKSAMTPVIERMNRIKGLEMDLLVVENKFFGSSVTVTGLLTGKDISKTIANNKTAVNIIIPGVALNDNDLFLDGYNIDQIKKELPEKNIYVCDNLEQILEVI